MEKKNIALFAKLAIALLCAMAFFPLLRGNFVYWDDPAYVINNDVIKTVSFNNLSSVFSSGFVGQYCPVTMLVYMLVYKFFGLNPFYYHLVSYILNIFVSLAVFTLVISLSENIIVAFLTAALFAVHPLHVESVAWISELKDVLCALFYILSLIAYIAYVKNGKARDYVLSAVLCLLALLSKAMAVSLPFAILAMDIFYRKKIDRRVAAEKIPFFFMAGVISVLTIHFHTQTEAFATSFPPGVWFYYLIKSLVFYFTKTIWPVDLSAVYSMATSLPPAVLAQTKFRLIGLAVLLAALVLFAIRDRRILLGLSLFFITIFPVLKIKTVSTAWAADRYMYIPSIGLLFAFVLIIDNIAGLKILKRLILSDRILITVISFFIIVFSLMTWSRCPVWHNTRTLFMDILLKDPGIGVFYPVLGKYYEDNGDLLKAEKFYERGFFVSQIEKFRDSVKRMREEIAKLPAGEAESRRMKETQKEKAEEAKLVNKIGEMRGLRGDTDTALALFQEAIELDPRNADAYNNLGFAFTMKQDYEKARACFRKALEIDPDHKKAAHNLRMVSGAGPAA